MGMRFEYGEADPRAAAAIKCMRRRHVRSCLGCVRYADGAASGAFRARCPYGIGRKDE